MIDVTSVQLILLDEVGGLMGFWSSSDFCTNCYFGRDSDIMIGQSVRYDLSVFKTVYPAKEHGSIQRNPDFVLGRVNNFHIRSASPCRGSGSDVQLDHFETGLPLTLGPDFDYQALQGEVDIGADEVPHGPAMTDSVVVQSFNDNGFGLEGR